MPFAKWRKFQVGTGRGRAGWSGMLAPSLTQGSSLLAAETILNRILLPANSLSRNGMTVRILCSGHMATNGNNKTINAYAGTTALFTSGAIAGNNINWLLELFVVRLGVGSNVTAARFISGTTTLTLPVTAPNFDETVDQWLSIQGVAPTADADILSYWMLAEVLTTFVP